MIWVKVAIQLSRVHLQSKTIEKGFKHYRSSSKIMDTFEKRKYPDPLSCLKFFDLKENFYCLYV